MNYYEHHLGDYVRDTAHLSMIEDGAYRRLLDAYYIREAPLPLSLRDVHRLVRASSKHDRDAVETVLREFFQETPEGWRHVRCDHEITRFREKSEKAKASIRARWEKARSGTKNEERPNNDRNTNVSSEFIRTYNEGNTPRARPQTPDTRHQSLEAELPTVNAAGAAKASRPMAVDDLVAAGVDPKVAIDWLAVRKAKKAPLTRTAWEGIVREAQCAGLTPAQAVKTAAENGWQGFKAVWLQRDRSAQATADIYEGAR